MRYPCGGADDAYFFLFFSAMQSYLNPNGLKYHLSKGTCTVEGPRPDLSDFVITASGSSWVRGGDRNKKGLTIGTRKATSSAASASASNSSGATASPGGKVASSNNEEEDGARFGEAYVPEEGDEDAEGSEEEDVEMD